LPATLGVLFALWVNLDAWFLLGPAAVGCADRRIDRTRSRLLPAGRDDPAEAGWPPASLALALAVGVIACLLNPHHIRAFTLPAELVGRSELRGDGLFDSYFQSPFAVPTRPGSATWRHGRTTPYWVLGFLSFPLKLRRLALGPGAGVAGVRRAEHPADGGTGRSSPSSAGRCWS